MEINENPSFKAENNINITSITKNELLKDDSTTNKIKENIKNSISVSNKNLILKSENNIQNHGKKSLQEKNILINLGKRHHEIFNEISSGLNNDRIDNNKHEFYSYKKNLNFLPKKAKVEYNHTEKVHYGPANKENIRRDYEMKNRTQNIPNLKNNIETKNTEKCLDKMDICDVKSNYEKNEINSLKKQEDKNEKFSISLDTQEKFIRETLPENSTNNNVRIHSNLKMNKINCLVR